MEERKPVNTENAPKPAGPYSQGITWNNLVFVAGQLATNPRTGEVPTGIEQQTRQALENMRAILEAAGSSLENVLRVTVYLRDLNDYSKMNEVYQSYFRGSPPARSLACSPLPGSFLIEIDAIASKST